MKVTHSIEEAMKIEKELKDALELNSFDLLKEIFDRFFEESIVNIENEYRIRGMIEFSNDIVKKKLSGEFLGGLVGERNGLTTMPKGDRVAMGLLKIAYDMKVKLYIGMCKSVELLVPKFIQLMPAREKEINEKFQKLCYEFFGLIFLNTAICTTSRENEEMMDPEFLQPAFENAQKKWKLNVDSHIEGCLPELENLYSGEEWERSRGLISVLKDILWETIKDCLVYKKSIMKGVK